MARIRSIKPRFFRHGDLQDLEIAHPGKHVMLVFAGLWGHCDRNGVFRWDARDLKCDILPFLPFEMAETLELLLGAGQIERYEVDGKTYGFIPTFSEHQRITGKEASEGSQYPSRPDVTGKQPGSTRETTGKQPGRQEGNRKGREQEGRESDDAIASSPSALMRAWNNGTTAPIPQCRELSPERRKKATDRLRDAALDVWVTVIARIEGSPFCRGENDRGWVATFDWLLQPETRVKVLEGKYDPRKPRAPGYAPAPQPEYRDDWFDECKRLHGNQCGGQRKHANRMAMDMAREKAS